MCVCLFTVSMSYPRVSKPGEVRQEYEDQVSKVGSLLSFLLIFFLCKICNFWWKSKTHYSSMCFGHQWYSLKTWCCTKLKCLINSSPSADGGEAGVRWGGEEGQWGVHPAATGWGGAATASREEEAGRWWEDGQTAEWPAGQCLQNILMNIFFYVFSASSGLTKKEETAFVLFAC